MVSGGLEVQLDLDALEVGYDYIIQDTADLNGSFADVPESGFTATNAVETVVVPADTGAKFYKVVSP